MSTFEEIFNERLKSQGKAPVNGLQKYFTAYLNMARQNCRITLAHISQTIGLNPDSVQEDAMWEAKILGEKEGLLSNRPEISDMIKNRILSLFPMLDPMIKRDESMTALEKETLIQAEKKEFSKTDIGTISPQNVAAVLTQLLQVLTYYRDMSSHILFNDTRTNDPEYIKTENAIADYLKYTFTIAGRIVKTRFSLKPTDLDFYNSNGLRYQLGETPDIANKKMADEKNKTKKIPVINTNFDHSTTVEGGRLSLMGLVYLTCMFIEKQYATMFFDVLQKRFYGICDRIPRKKDKKSNQTIYLFQGKEAEAQKEKQRMILREIYSLHRIHLPKERLDSTRDDMANALDMLNELRKCPQELFDHISRADQEKFEITDINGERVLLRRNKDRFAKLALQYIDENRLFNNIRFHITFGKYRYIFQNNKTCADGISRVRWLQKELNGFGRIQEIEHKRTGEVKGWNGVELIRPFENVVSDEDSSAPYITDFRSQYLFNQDKIGILKKEFIPQIELNETGKPVFHTDKNGNNHVVLERKSPDAYLSTFEIPALIFNLLLYPKNTKNSQEPTCTEKLIKNCLEVYQELFTDFETQNWDRINPEHITRYSRDTGKATEFMLTWEEVPRKIRDKICGKKRKPFQELAREAIAEMIARNTRQIEHFKADLEQVHNKDNQQGKKNYVDIRPGRLANFLSRDIVRLQPTRHEGKDKPTGMNYRIMQAFIATYGSNGKTVGQLKELFRHIGVIDSENEHPFLKEVITQKNPKNTLDFYLAYITRRKEYLKDVLAKGNFKEVGFLNSGRQKWAVDEIGYCEKLAKSYATKPILLPRSLFARSIRLALEQIPEMHEALTHERWNTTFLINEYFKTVKQDAPQGFYSMKRAYRVFDKLKLSKEPVYLDLNERQEFNLNKRKEFDPLVIDYFKRQYTKLTQEYNEALEKHNQSVYAFNKWKKQGKHGKAPRKFACPQKPDLIAQEIEDFESLLKPNNQNIIYQKEILRLKHAREEYDDCERTLRRYQVQDILLFLLAKNKLVQTGNQLDKFKLRDIDSSDTEKSILSGTVDEFSLDIKWKGENEQGEKITGTTTVKEKDVVIKNYGRIFRLVYDDRVKKLLPQISKVPDGLKPTNPHITFENGKTIIDKKILDEDLKNYDLKRHEVCDLILRFEQAIIGKHPDFIGQDDRIDFLYIIKKLEEHHILQPEDSRILRLVRNAYNHNSYPEAGFAEEINCNTLPHITKQLMSKFQKIAEHNKKK